MAILPPKIPPGLMPQGLVLTTGGSPAFDPAAAAYFAQVQAGGGSITPARKTIYNNYYLALRAIDPTLAQFYRIFDIAAQDQVAALLDLINLQTGGLTAPNPTFTIDRGYTMNGTSNNVTSNYIPNSSTPVAQQNSFFMACYVNQVGASGANGMGTLAGTFPQCEMVCPYLDGTFHAQINDSGFGGGTFAVPGTGLYIADRVGAGSVILNYNGVDLGDTGDGSTGVPNNPILLGNANPVESESRYAFMAFGLSLGANRVAFANATIAFLTAFGAN